MTKMRWRNLLPKNEKAEKTIPVPPETASVTKHDWTAGGHVIHYTATAGNLLLRNEKDEPIGSIFYVAYTQELVKNVEFGYYPAGHMAYLNVEALKQMKGDMDRFYTESTQR